MLVNIRMIAIIQAIESHIENRKAGEREALIIDPPPPSKLCLPHQGATMDPTLSWIRQNSAAWSSKFIHKFIDSEYAKFLGARGFCFTTSCCKRSERDHAKLVEVHRWGWCRAIENVTLTHHFNVMLYFQAKSVVNCSMFSIILSLGLRHIFYKTVAYNIYTTKIHEYMTR